MLCAPSRGAWPQVCVGAPIAPADTFCFSSALGATLCFKGVWRLHGVALIQEGPGTQLSLHS